MADKVRPFSIGNFEPTLTKQADADACDINKIAERHRKTGIVTHLNTRQPFYGDVSSIASYQEALGVVKQAEHIFDQLPAKVRSRFANNPFLMVEFLKDPSNREEAIRLGIVNKPPEAPTVPPVVPPVVNP